MFVLIVTKVSDLEVSRVSEVENNFNDLMATAWAATTPFFAGNSRSVEAEIRDLDNGRVMFRAKLDMTV